MEKKYVPIGKKELFELLRSNYKVIVEGNSGQLEVMLPNGIVNLDSFVERHESSMPDVVEVCIESVPCEDVSTMTFIATYPRLLFHLRYDNWKEHKELVFQYTFGESKSELMKVKQKTYSHRGDLKKRLSNIYDALDCEAINKIRENNDEIDEMIADLAFAIDDIKEEC